MKHGVIIGFSTISDDENIMLEDKLADIGDCTVHVVDDPVMLGALGGLRLSMEVPTDMWSSLTLASR